MLEQSFTLSGLLSLLPPWLVIAIAILIILPTGVGIGLRIFLFRYLRKTASKVMKGIQNRQQDDVTGEPDILRKAKQRFREASMSDYLEEVNTVALIDGLYREESFSLAGIPLRCEVWDYFTRILPNLLIALGLLGTFLGITLNLAGIAEITETFSPNSGDVEGLISQLQEPLQGMGVAFITSLVAIACSLILILVNFRNNTGFAKLQLLGALEDYLDNIYLPGLKTNTRMGLAVDRMVEEQHQFLERFHQNVTEAVESSLGRIARQIAEGNREAAEIARQVYDRFTETAGTLAGGATQFENAVINFDRQLQANLEKADSIVDKFGTQSDRSLNSFQEMTAAMQQSSGTFARAAEQIERSGFSEKLDTTVAHLAATQSSFAETTSFFAVQVRELITHSNRVTQLAEQIYSQLNTASESLDSSATVFQAAAKTIKQSQFSQQIATATGNLKKAQNQFGEAIAILHESSQTARTSVTALDNFVRGLGELAEEIKAQSQTSTEILSLNRQRLDEETAALQEIENQLKQAIAQVQQRDADAAQRLQKFSNSFLDLLGRRFTETAQNEQALTAQIEKATVGINQGTSELTAYTQTMKTEFQRAISAMQTRDEVAAKHLQVFSDNLFQILNQRFSETAQNEQVLTEKIEKATSGITQGTASLTDSLKSLQAQFQQAIAAVEKRDEDAAKRLQEWSDSFLQSLSQRLATTTQNER